jgi:hypothetical protein
VELKVGVRLVIVEGLAGSSYSSFALFQNHSFKWHGLVHPVTVDVGGGGMVTIMLTSAGEAQEDLCLLCWDDE